MWLMDSCYAYLGEARQAKGTPEQLYQKGYEAYQDGWYKRAIEYFQKVRDQYPLSKLALLAELGIADSQFSDRSMVRLSWPTMTS